MEMQVRLVRKVAERLDGIDVSEAHVGDVIDVSEDDARILIAEGWATPYDPNPASDATELDDSKN